MNENAIRHILTSYERKREQNDIDLKNRKNDIYTRIPEIKEGDILSFRNAGAYCFSMASNYNSRYKPAEVLWMNGKGHLIRAHEAFEDLLKNQIPLPNTVDAV